MKFRGDYVKKHFTLKLIILIMLLSVIFITTLKWNNTANKRNIFYERAKIISIKDEDISDDSVFSDIKIGSQDIQIEILTGNYKGEEYNIKNLLSRIYSVRTKPGMEIIVAVYVDNGEIKDISVYSYKREMVLFGLIALFFVVLSIVGGKKGVKSIVALIFTGITVVFFLVPLILRGVSPIIAATLTAVITTAASLLLINGLSKRTASAMAGTIIGVIIAGFIAFAAGQLAHLSGFTVNDADHLLFIAQDSGFNLKGLMYASILIASLGAIMDIGMSISSAIFEIHRLNTKMKFRELYQSGMNVGKDIIGTMSNTLILALAGGSLNLIIMLTYAQMPYNQLINLDLLGTEIIQSIAGTIGIVLTVPITAVITAYFIKHSKLK